MLGSEHLAEQCRKGPCEGPADRTCWAHDQACCPTAMARLFVLLEQVEEKSDPIAGSSPMQYTYSWVYDDALVLSMDASSGDLDWWQHRQASGGARSTPVDEFGSYPPYLKEDRFSCSGTTRT